MWISKEGDVRKKEFIDTAIAIFLEKGYENASINDILKQINITKGAFYYYFDSKEGLLDAVTEELAGGLFGITEGVTERNDLSAVDKLKLLYYETTRFRKDNIQLYQQFMQLYKKEENALIAKKLMDKALKMNVSYISGIITQGINEGVFHTSNADETAELYIRIAGICKEKIASLLMDSAEGSKSSDKMQTEDINSLDKKQTADINSSDKKQTADINSSDKKQTKNINSSDKIQAEGSKLDKLQAEVKIKDLLIFYQEILEKILGAEKGTLNPD